MFASKDLMFGQQPTGGYQISRSVRLRSSASAYFSKTFSGAGNLQTYTISFWAKRGVLSTTEYLFVGFSGSVSSQISFNSSDQLVLNVDGGNGYQITTSAVYRDPSAWYHIVAAVDTTQATAANRLKLYVNGVQVTALASSSYPTQNSNTYFFGAYGHWIGSSQGPSQYFDGYLTEFNAVNAQQLAPTSFGAFDAVTGVWNPKAYSGTYGTNGFYLNFSDNTSPPSATTIGKDSSGNGNNWTPTSISLTTGTTYDSMVDSPTNYGTDTGVGGSVRGNYATLNPLDRNTTNPTNANLTWDNGTSNHYAVRGTISPTSKKWYFETYVGTVAGVMSLSAGVCTSTAALDFATTNQWFMYTNATITGVFISGTPVTCVGFSAPVVGDILQVAYDADTNSLWLGKNNVWANSTGGTTGNPSAGTNPTATSLPTGLFPYIECYAAVTNTNFGQRPFAYTAPTGFKALCTQNLPTATVSNGANYMAATLYTGTGSSQTVSNAVNSISFQPDMVWIKSRSAATDNKLTDSVRGATIALVSNSTAAETTDSTGLTAFGSSGFTVGASTTYNNSGATYVGWQWKGGGTATNIAIGQYGTSIPSIASSVSANTTAGFSVVTYTGTGVAGTVGHGLGVVPAMIIAKRRSAVQNWGVWHTSLAGTQTLYLDLTQGVATGVWNGTPSSTLFNITTDGVVNASTSTYVAYCFAAITGYSAFGSYTGNSAANGAFIYCGFRPRYIFHKASSTTSQWMIWDTARNTYNVLTNAELLANSANGEGAGAWGVEIDILSNGFKFRGFDNANFNYSGVTYIYAAFAENPFTISRAR